MTLASRIVVLAGGGISQVGTPLELYEKPENEFVAQFIGSPAMNLLPGEIVETGERTTIKMDGGGTAVSHYPSKDSDRGARVKVGVRPEDFVAADTDYIFQGKVDIVEALGEVTLLYFETGDADLEDMEKGDAAVIAKLQGTHKDLRGNDVKLGADPSRVHIFRDGRSMLYD